MSEKLQAAREQRDAALKQMQDAASVIEALADDATDEARDAADKGLGDAEIEFERSVANLSRVERVSAARALSPIIVPADEAARGTGRLTVGDDRDLVYRQDRPVSFFADMHAAHRGDTDARNRIDQHSQEMRARETRDVTTADPGAAGLVPPVYLADMLTETARQGRPTVNIFPSFPFPPAGGALTVPRLTTAATAAVQTAEANAPSETDIDLTLLSVPLVTIAGQQDMSIQALERTFPGLDQIVFADLVGAYDNALDVQILEGTGSSGQHLGVRAVSGINTVTYTDASPTAAETVPPLFNAFAKVHNVRFRPPTHLIMTPLRAAFLAANLGTTFSLFKVGAFGANEIGAQEAGLAYTFAGLPIVVDANITQTRGAATNEDEVYAVRAPDLYFAEGPLRMRIMDQVLSGTLQVRLQVFAYSYFISGRYPAAITKVSGTGLTAPTF
jgi:HK97 family phage major capsid protein